MKRGRSLTVAALLSLLGAAVLIVLVWHYVVLALVGYVAYRILRRKTGGRRRYHRPRLPQYLEALAAAYAAYRVPKAIENVTVPAGGEVQMIVKGRPSRVKR